MSNRHGTPLDDSEESLISQFETTLTIRPTDNEGYGDDISIDHTTFRDISIADAEALNEHDEETIDDTTLEDSIVKSKPDKKYSLRTNLATKEANGRLISDNAEHEIQVKYRDILKPSPSIDYGLTKFKNSFAGFLNFNPHIKRQSPRYNKESDKTLIILSPFSAEHAFGRKWVTKSYLSTIFERPQRLLASCIGISAAISMFPFYYKLLNSTKRGSILADYVRKVHGQRWPKMLLELSLDSHEKLQNNEMEVPENWNTGDIYLTPKTITALEGVIGAIELGVDSLFADKKDNHSLAFVAIRPPGHHSHACLPSGFCLLNNAQLAIEYAFETYGVSHCAILDIDLHHGDGSQDICWERAGFEGDYGKSEEDESDGGSNKRDSYGKRFSSYPKVGYFSLHDVKSYPTELGYATKENIRNASTCIMDHDLAIWNVHLQEWVDEGDFYKHYRTRYVSILNRANQFLNNAKKQHEALYETYLKDMVKYQKLQTKSNGTDFYKPSPPPPFKPLIVISAGFDASEYENPLMQRHQTNVPTSFYSRFTRDAVKLANIHTSGKVLSFLEGGYSDGALCTGIFSHLIGLVSDENVEWNQTWGGEQVMKEMVKGCKANWYPYKKPHVDIKVWANEVIKLGRSMMPNAILPQNYIYQYREPQKEPISNMVKAIVDTEQDVPLSPIKLDAQDSRKVVRHTRAYHKRLNHELAGSSP